MSLTLTPPPPSLASHRRRCSAAAAAGPPRSRLRVLCVATCHAPPSPAAAPSIAGLEPRRRERLSLYEILRVREDASAREIKAAYRALAKAYHPDAAGETDGRDFIQIHSAYETLSDPAARAVYDLSLGSGRRRRQQQQRAGWAGFCSTRRWETDQCW
ncbi:hypothetical protein ACJRO7_023840 [Eucalyptus globulus]|uniref:J domain-containing protein n=1 Tax=Eucalyptus globulus TaxID=34317 RepID=A0ABD3K5J1_EUCGL